MGKLRFAVWIVRIWCMLTTGLHIQHVSAVSYSLRHEHSVFSHSHAVSCIYVQAIDSWWKSYQCIGLPCYLCHYLHIIHLRTTHMSWVYLQRFGYHKCRLYFYFLCAEPEKLLRHEFVWYGMVGMKLHEMIWYGWYDMVRWYGLVWYGVWIE